MGVKSEARSTARFLKVTREALITKFEALNPKQYQMTKIRKKRETLDTGLRRYGF